MRSPPGISYKKTMSLQFSNAAEKSGILELIDENCGTTPTSYPVESKTAAVNLALDRYTELAIKSSGMWQWDDSNHEKYPIIKTNLVDGRRDYKFTTDEEGALVLDIYKVFVADEQGIYHEIYPVDVQSERGTESFTDGLNTEGVPFRYDKTANGIFLDSIPSYNATLGIMVYVNREGSHFVKTDTSKRPGVPGIHHEYFVLRPSYSRARTKSLKNKNDLKADLLQMEKDIIEYFGRRERDRSSVLQGRPVNFI